MLRIKDYNINTLIIIKINFDHVIFTAKQLRRVKFKMKE